MVARTCGSLITTATNVPSVNLQRLPKVVLHDHLDGGLRSQTVIELADAVGYPGLPTADADDLARWFFQGDAGSLEEYLAAFDHTIGVMQTNDAVERVAFEAGADLANDGVVYAELRFAPSGHVGRGLSRTEVLEAALAGMERAEAEHGIVMRIIVDALRQHSDSDEVAAAAIEMKGGVVGFDLAGPEAGFPAKQHRRACEAALEAGLGLTIHAGEGDGVASIAEALDCGAQRIGHGVRIVEDLVVLGGELRDVGPTAQRLLDESIVLEVCPTSNIDTKMFAGPEDHPLGLLRRSGFAVTLNTDNRLMSGTSMSAEYGIARDHHGFDRIELRDVTLRAIDSAFCDDSTRDLVRSRIEAGYAAP